MNFKYLRTLGASISLLMPLSAYATNGMECTGTVEILGLHSPNNVTLKLSGMNTLVVICDLGATKGTVNPVPAAQCNATYSTLLSAYAMKKPLNIVFDNAVTGTNCSTFAPWEVATARWVAFQ